MLIAIIVFIALLIVSLGFIGCQNNHPLSPLSLSIFFQTLLR